MDRYWFRSWIRVVIEATWLRGRKLISLLSLWYGLSKLPVVVEGGVVGVLMVVGVAIVVVLSVLVIVGVIVVSILLLLLLLLSAV